MSPTLRAAALSAALVGLFALPACGDDTAEQKQPTSSFGKQTAAEISSAARSDMESLRSLSIHGVTEELTFDISLADDGSCVGTIEQGAGKAEVIETADGSYVRGNAAYWRAQATTAEDKATVETSIAKWDGRWLRTSRELGYLLPQCDFERFVPVLTQGDRKLATVGEEREIDGDQAIALVATQNGITSTVWISTESPHRVLELTEKGADAATYTLSDFDEPLDITTPDPAEVYDLAEATKKAE